MIVIDTAAGITSFSAAGDVILVLNWPRSIRDGSEDNQPENVPSFADDESVARGNFNSLPIPEAATKPTKEDGTAFVNLGSI